jgi:hypothetical protein
VPQFQIGLIGTRRSGEQTTIEPRALKSPKWISAEFGFDFSGLCKRRSQ